MADEIEEVPLIEVRTDEPANTFKLNDENCTRRRVPVRLLSYKKSILRHCRWWRTIIHYIFVLLKKLFLTFIVRPLAHIIMLIFVFFMLKLGFDTVSEKTYSLWKQDLLRHFNVFENSSHQLFNELVPDLI